MPAISAVIPAFNEEDAIAATVTGVARALAEIGADFEVVVVDDGSRDRTADVVLGLGAELPTVRLVSHATNRGYGAALATGFAAAQKELLFLTDVPPALTVLVSVVHCDLGTHSQFSTPTYEWSGACGAV